MTRPVPERYTDTQRMELLSHVELAGEVIAPYWPMRTFVHHNPLHGLESLSFEQAVQHGSHLFGGRGYLPNAEYRRHLASGRISLNDLRAALEPWTFDRSIVLGGRRLSHAEVLTLSMLHGVTESDRPSAGASPKDEERITERMLWLARASTMDGPIVPDSPSLEPHELSERETLSAWCDRTLGTRLVETINRELIKWCGAFLDEGEATWAMPQRERGFYRAWRDLAQDDFTLRLIGIRNAADKLRDLPDCSEDALLNLLHDMGIPHTVWEPYFSEHLASLPGWVGYIKWRSHEKGHPWQEAYPIDLANYLAVRLFYERELVESACRTYLALAGTNDERRRYARHFPAAYRLRRDWISGLVSPSIHRQVTRLARSSRRYDHAAWEAIGRHHDEQRRAQNTDHRLRTAARHLVRFFGALGLDDAIDTASPSDLRTLLSWLDGLPASQQGPIWLEAFETAHRRQVLRRLAGRLTAEAMMTRDDATNSRPLAQLVFCIDVRSEIFRRHLEHVGGYETLGLAGFFGVPLDFQSFGAHQTVSHCPVLLKPKNLVREVPRSYHDRLAKRHKNVARLGTTTYELLQELKENVITPYVMVEAFGWFFCLPLFGRTLLPIWYDKIKQWITNRLVPPIATTLTVEKLSREEAEAMVAAEQQAIIREVIRERLGRTGTTLSATLLDQIRRKALGEGDRLNGEVAKALNLSPEAEAGFYAELRDRYCISPHGVSARLARLTRTGFSTSEQAYLVEAALRLMGLTSNFARVVVFCAHGSTSENNPYESALDCGACGGNQGLPNARAIAAMANKPTVRELLLRRGITVPTDTHFFAAQHDTTTDVVRLVDLEDVPATHRKDLEILMADLDAAGRGAAMERAGALPISTPTQPRLARQQAIRRSRDWAETRPEWGLSGNSLIVIGRRALTRGVNLRGRAFLHSYDYRQDQSGKLLETILTAPLVVAQWINMEHYFSTVDNRIYGSGSKVYHNVVGRIGVMTGVWSDLRLGLPAQTVLNGAEPYHEPMRLLAVVEAPRERIQWVIDRHPLLDRLFNLGWMTLVALDPQDQRFYRYHRGVGWKPEPSNQGAHGHDELDAASHERN
ncbi:MAG: DUF2309 domain-containing protein [Nitrospira sp.]|nr:DUF2309 domain-containing protein [Nitrospira sp.]MCP9441730.1 DUF2309 domain-containing protein [Nitrospira sp.]